MSLIGLTGLGGCSPDPESRATSGDLDEQPESKETTTGFTVDQEELDVVLEAGHEERLVAWLDQGLDPTFALVRAARVGSVPMVTFLLGRGVDPNGFLDDGYRSTALMAASGNHPQVVPALVAAGADLDQADSVGDPALHWASYMGQTEVARALVDAGARTDVLSVHGNAFDIALRQGWKPLLELFAGDPARGLDDAESNLLAAVASGEIDGAREALGGGASPDLAHGIPVLALAAEFGPADMVDLLLNSGARVDALDPIGFSALHYASRSGGSEIVRRLARAGANLDRAGSEAGMSMSPLHMAAAHGRREAARALLDLGATIDSRDSRGETPLLWSLSEGQPETGLLLLAAGADPDLESRDGYSPRDTAESAAEAQGMAEVLVAMAPAA